MPRNGGFTLIELMIVIAIIGILSAIAVPQFGKVVKKSREATTLGNLATLRMGITLYTAETGRPPTDDLTSVLVAGHLKEIPLKDTPWHHGHGNTVSAGPASDQPASRGSWFYFNQPDEPKFGRVEVNCAHADMKGRIWLTY